MSTTSRIQDISQAFKAPAMLTEADAEQVSMILDAYPYFVPARYIVAAQSHKGYAFAPNTVADMQLFKGNWLLYHQFLQAATAATKQETKPAVESHEDEFDTFVFNRPGTSFTFTPRKGPVQEVEEEKQEEELPVAPQYEQEPANYVVENITFTEEPATDDTLILPIYTEDYFLHQGVQVSNDMPDNVEELTEESMAAQENEDEDKSLMVVMSFSEWLNHFKSKTQREREEREDQKVLKTMWQKEKLAGALEEENEEIPENVFEMAVNSITKEEDLISEPLIEIYVKQGKYDKAIEMYRKLSLRNPQKNAYFARKIEAILKEKQS